MRYIREANNVSTKYVMGVDLGQMRDYSAIGIVERMLGITVPQALPGTFQFTLERRRIVAEYHLRFLERPQLGTPYTSIAEMIVTLMKSNELRDDCEVVVDATGVGKPVIDMISQKGIRVIPVTITGGFNVVSAYEGYHVPKRDLVSAVQVLIESRRFKVANSLALADVLKREMENFKAKITRLGETYEAWREREHDDLVLAVALALWYASKGEEHESFWQGGKKDDGGNAEYDPLGRGERKDDGYANYDPFNLPQNE